MVSTFRLWLMRAGYLLIAAGLAVVIWPRLISHPSEWGKSHGSTSALLAGLSVMAALGLKFPLQMLPVLLFEFVWKVIWMLLIALPLWRAGQIDAGVSEDIFAVGMGVVLMPIVIPWRYLFGQFLRAK